MNENALTNAELELTQKIQRHFPRGKVHPDHLKMWNELPSDILTGKLLNLFGAEPEIKPPDKEISTTNRQPQTLISAEAQLISWVELYKELGITLDPMEIKIPDRRFGFDYLDVIPKGMTSQKAFELCLARFQDKCWKYPNQSLDLVVPEDKSDRTATKGAYAIWIRDRQEADEELKNLSADNLTKKQIKGITLCERLLFEIKYHAETGKHLDTKNWTLCSGSRNSVGDVPGVYWRGARLYVSWSYSSYLFAGLRSREVVTIDS